MEIIYFWADDAGASFELDEDDSGAVDNDGFLLRNLIEIRRFVYVPTLKIFKTVLHLDILLAFFRHRVK